MINNNISTAARRGMRCAAVWGKVLCTTAVMIAAAGVSYGQTGKERDSVKVQKLETIVISSSRADNKTPLTTSTIGRKQLDDAKIAVSMPYMMELEPSVVTTSENGMVGVASMRIRGVDASRINVNINGVTLNDAESQSVYWYNIPNLGGMSQSVQLQRGVGASNGGSAAFGGALNMQTLNASSKPYATADLSWGSFNTRQYGFVAGSGITKSGFAFDAAYNGLTSDGFVRGGQTDQQSLFLSAGHYGERSLLKVLAIIGKQKSGITWDGAYAEDLDADPTFNGRGKIKDQYGNVYYYPNETDNYWQQHYQVYYSYLLSDFWSINTTLDYTHGNGYTESYKRNKDIYWMGFDTALMGFRYSDLVYRKQMRNDAYSASIATRYSKDRLTANIGGSYMLYDGDHYGEVIWLQKDTAFTRTRISLDNIWGDSNWYFISGLKHDVTAFAKFSYDFSSLFNLYADLQFRYVDYSMHGTDDDYGQLDFDQSYPFFNPKVGLNYRFDDSQRLYLVAGLSHREPARADIKEAVYYNKEIKAEAMLDIELGYQLKKQDLHFEGNLYAMLYKDQLTPNGLVTESNYALMENVDKSYRLGVELVAGYRISRLFSLDGNLTLSMNKIVDYTADLSESWGSAAHNLYNFGETDLALSPSVVSAAVFTYRPVDKAKIQLIGKYVGEQYADNTGREESKLDAYFLLNARASYTFELRSHNQIECQLAVNNILDLNYRITAWCGTYYDPATGDITTDRGFFQQPGRNFMARVSYKF